MTYLVTGGAGFIGSNFIFYILRKYPDARVVCVDKLTYAGNLSTLSSLLGNPRVLFVKADICDQRAMDAVFERERPDCVVNFAAESHVDRSIENAEVFLKTNVLGVGVLLDACVRFGGVRYHQVSTDEVYGDLPLEKTGRAFCEDSPLLPSSPYSSSKAAADLLTLSYFRTHGLFVTVSRCSNNYGPYQFPEKLIPLMTVRAMQGKNLPVYGTGKNVRDWIWVDDHCKAVDMIVRGGRAGEVYNVGARAEADNLTLVKRICALLDRNESCIEFVADRKGHDLRYAIDPSKIERELGWRAETDFNGGLVRTVKWYQNNRRWWQAIESGEYRSLNEKLWTAYTDKK